MNQFPPSPRVSHYDRSKFFRKFAEIFASQSLPPVGNLPPVSMTPAAKFATGINDTGGKFCHQFS
jgi:hypothetical protein